MADETEIKFRFTTKGQQVSAAILGGKDKIEFTKAAASIDLHINDTDADVANIVDLDNKKQIVDISDTVAVNNNVVQIPIKFEKSKIIEDYQMNTIGIYAKYQGQEFLYAFGALKYPLYMHHTDDSGVFKMYTYITVGTVANVVIKTDNTESVSRDDLSRILVDYPTKSDIAGKANIADVYTKDEVNKLVESAGKVKTVNGKNGDVQVPVYASNLIDGTSNYNQTVTGTNALLSTTKVPAQVGDTFSAQLWIDNTKSTSGDDMVALWAYNSGDTALYAVKGNVISQGSAGYSKVDMTVTNANVSYLTLHLSGTGTTVREAKVAKWQDANTPPDMTWVPTIEDYRADYAALSEKIDVGDDIEDIGRKLADKANASDVYTKFQTDNRLSLKANASDVYSKLQADSKFGGAIKKIDGYSPDSSGNMNLDNTYATINSVNKKANTSDIYTQSQIDQKLYFKANTYDVYNRDEIDDKLNKKLSGFSNPDYVFGSSSTIDVDGVVSGVFALNGCSLEASKGGSYVFTNVDLATYNWGYLVVSNYNGFTGGYHVGACVEYLVLLGTYNDVVGVYIRSFSPNDSYYNNVFKKLTN